jgi:predicted nucleic acid-binding protein
MAAVLLDTTVLIDLLRGRAGAAARLDRLRESGDTPYVCAVNVEEVTRGLRNEREAHAARQLFEGLRVTPLGREQGEQAGEWRKQYAKRGRTLAQADCLVAAAAATVGGRLATANTRDFPMRELAVETWPAGE